jgi:hypothetical protein
VSTVSRVSVRLIVPGPIIVHLETLRQVPRSGNAIKGERRESIDAAAQGKENAERSTGLPRQISTWVAATIRLAECSAALGPCEQPLRANVKLS